MGKVISNQFLISGHYDGECEVDYLEITKSGQVDGDIKAKQLVVAKGGSFNGRCADSRAEQPSGLAELRLESVERPEEKEEKQ